MAAPAKTSPVLISGCSSGPQTAPDGLKFGVIHHTVNSNTYDAADVLISAGTERTMSANTRLQ